MWDGGYGCNRIQESEDRNQNPYIADFGIARLAAATSTVTIIGTPNYMAPEQAEGGELSPQADIYQMFGYIKKYPANQEVRQVMLIYPACDSFTAPLEPFWYDCHSDVLHVVPYDLISDVLRFRPDSLVAATIQDGGATERSLQM